MGRWEGLETVRATDSLGVSGMSLVGHSRHFGDVPVTSGPPPNTDMALRRNNWREVPLPDSRSRGGAGIRNGLSSAFIGFAR